MGGYRRLFILACLLVMTISTPTWPDAVPAPDQGTFQPRAPSLEQAEPPEGLRNGRMVAAQVSLFYCENLNDVEERIRRLAEAGFNTLIVRVFHNQGDRPYRFADPQHYSGVYFQTQHAPVVDDVLGPVARLAHQHGLRVFAWMTTRHANYGLENMNGLQAWCYDFEKDTLVPARGFNIFRPEVVARLEGLYSDLARYPIEGILFQDDLILRHNEGFSREARELFLQHQGYSPEPWLLYGPHTRREDGRIVPSSYTERFWEWSRWKNRKILNLAGRLMNAARVVKPDLQFAVNLYYETVLDPEKGMAWFSQSLEAARDLPFNYFSIMAYHRQMKEELGLTMDETLNLMPHLVKRSVEMAGDPARVLVKVQVADWNNSKLLPQEEMERVLKAVGERPDIHIAVVPYQPGFPAHTLIRPLTYHQTQVKQERAPVQFDSYE